VVPASFGISVHEVELVAQMADDVGNGKRLTSFRRAESDEGHQHLPASEEWSMRRAETEQDTTAVGWHSAETTVGLNRLSGGGLPFGDSIRPLPERRGGFYRSLRAIRKPLCQGNGSFWLLPLCPQILGIEPLQRIFGLREASAGLTAIGTHRL
jgi:hypothetical protein